MKSLKTIALVSCIALATTTSVFASWWNPFTWGIFKRNVPIVQQIKTVSTSEQEEIKKKPSDAIATTTPVVENDLTKDWKTYTNSKVGYEIKYPIDSKIELSKDTLCLHVVTRDFGEVYVNGGYGDPCGSPTGLGTEMIRSDDTVSSSGKEYKTSGWVNSNKSTDAYSFYSLDFKENSKISIVYGVNHTDISDSNHYKGLGPLTDDEYKNAINSAKKVLSTFKFNQVGQVSSSGALSKTLSKGVVLLGDNSKYEKLSKEQKAILEEYYATLSKDVRDELSIDSCVLKYYDEKKVIVGCVSKMGYQLVLLERTTWKNISSDSVINTSMGYLEAENYLISVTDNGIYYYKSGDDSVTSIKDTQLPLFDRVYPEYAKTETRERAEYREKNNKEFARLNSKNETYIRIGGMADEYDVSFDKQTKTLTVGVFKRTNSETHPKTRTVKFVLH